MRHYATSNKRNPDMYVTRRHRKRFDAFVDIRETEGVVPVYSFHGMDRQDELIRTHTYMYMNIYRILYIDAIHTYIHT